MEMAFFIFTQVCTWVTFFLIAFNGIGRFFAKSKYGCHMEETLQYTPMSTEWALKDHLKFKSYEIHFPTDSGYMNINSMLNDEYKTIKMMSAATLPPNMLFLSPQGAILDLVGENDIQKFANGSFNKPARIRRWRVSLFGKRKHYRR